VDGSGAISSGLLSQINVPIRVYAVGHNPFRGQPDFSDCFQKIFCTCWHGFVCWAQKQWERERRPRVFTSFVAQQNAITAMHYNFFSQNLQDYFDISNHHPENFVALTVLLTEHTYATWEERNRLFAKQLME